MYARSRVENVPTTVQGTRLTGRHVVELFKRAQKPTVLLDMRADNVTRVTRLITMCTRAGTVCNFIKPSAAPQRPAEPWLSTCAD